MAYAANPRRWGTRTVRAAAVLAALLAALSAGLAAATPAEERKKEDDKKPPAATDGPELLQPKDAATRPAATKPATKPAVEVPADARQLLDAVRDAYKNVKTLKLAGTLTSDIDVNGEQINESAEFTAAFAGPLTFRHQTRERAAGANGGAAGGAAAGPRDATAFGGTGKKLYAFEPRYKYYYLTDAPAERPKSSDLPEQLRGLLTQLNPSLLLAVVPDAAEELLDGVSAVAKVDDVKVGDAACPALKLTIGKEAEVVVAFDPKTNLLRRVVWDRKGYAAARKQQDVKKVLVTVDYATTELDADLKGVDFAWRPPEGARDVTSLADAGSADDEAAAEGAAAALVGKDAPDFKLKDLAGQEVKLADLKGSVVLLDFWATWCGPCRTSMPHLDAIHKDLKDQGLKSYAVNLREGEAEVKKFVEKTSLGLPVLFDKDGKVAKSYGVRGIPQTVVIDKDGKVKKVVIGSGTHDQVRKAIEEALK